MNDSNTPPLARKVRISRVLLIASLALNFAVIGLVIGTALRGEQVVEMQAEQTRARSLQGRDFGMGPFIGALDSEARSDIGRAFVERAGKHDAARQDVRMKLNDTMALLTAEPFDADGFRENLSRQHAQFSERQVIGAMVLTDYLAEMSGEERAAYVTRLQEILTRPLTGGQGSERGDKHGGGSRPD